MQTSDGVFAVDVESEEVLALDGGARLALAPELPEIEAVTWT